MENEKKEIVIKKIYHNTERKDGTPIVTKGGDPYTKVTIETINGTKLYGNSFKEDDDVRNWRDGETHKVIVEQNGEYLNFIPADDVNQDNKILQEILKVLKEIRDIVEPNPFDNLDEDQKI